MVPAMSRFARMDMIREACESTWVQAFLRERGPLKAEEMLEVGREAVFLYLREHHANAGIPDRDEAFRALSEEIVILRSTTGGERLCLAGRWMVSEQGDTHDGEYAQVAPRFAASSRA